MVTFYPKHRAISRKVNFTVLNRLDGPRKPANPVHDVSTYPGSDEKPEAGPRLRITSVTVEIAPLIVAWPAVILSFHDGTTS